MWDVPGPGVVRTRPRDGLRGRLLLRGEVGVGLLVELLLDLGQARRVEGPLELVEPFGDVDGAREQRVAELGDRGRDLGVYVSDLAQVRMKDANGSSVKLS